MSLFEPHTQVIPRFKAGRPVELRVDLGFRPEGAVTWQLRPGRAFASDSDRTAFYSALTARVAALPGVRGVGLTDTPPLGRNRSWTVRAEGVV